MLEKRRGKCIQEANESSTVVESLSSRSNPTPCLPASALPPLMRFSLSSLESRCEYYHLSLTLPETTVQLLLLVHPQKWKPGPWISGVGTNLKEYLAS